MAVLLGWCTFEMCVWSSKEWRHLTESLLFVWFCKRFTDFLSEMHDKIPWEDPTQTLTREKQKKHIPTAKDEGHYSCLLAKWEIFAFLTRQVQKESFITQFGRFVTFFNFSGKKQCIVLFIRSWWAASCPAAATKRCQVWKSSRTNIRQVFNHCPQRRYETLVSSQSEWTQSAGL